MPKPVIGPGVTVGRRATVGVSVPQAPTVVVVAESFYYEHVQSVASANWTIQHNLGKKPNISVYDDEGREQLVNVEHLSNNVAHINWSQPTAGSAICS